VIPEFQTLMRPLLSELSDGSARRARDLVATMSDQFALDEEERAALLPSGSARLIDNRVNWALSATGSRPDSWHGQYVARSRSPHPVARCSPPSRTGSA
jgi:Mrr N-terminal domain